MSFIYKNNTASKLQISTEELSRRDGKELRSCADGEGAEELAGSVPLSGQVPSQSGHIILEEKGLDSQGDKGWL